MITNSKLLIPMFFFLMFGNILLAQTARLVHYEGVLKSAEDLPFDGATDLEFKIYKTLSSDSPVWTELHQDVQVQGGSYHVLLGSKNPLKLLFFEYYLEVTPGAVAVTPPRRMIVGSGYNYRLWFLFAAYTIVWVALFIFVLSIARRQKNVATELTVLAGEDSGAY